MYEDRPMSDGPEVERVPSFEGRIKKLYHLADQLERKVRPFSYPSLVEASPNMANEPVSTDLNRKLDSVISTFEGIISRIDD